MTRRPRRNHSSAFKAKLALAARQATYFQNGANNCPIFSAPYGET